MKLSRIINRKPSDFPWRLFDISCRACDLVWRAFVPLSAGFCPAGFWPGWLLSGPHLRQRLSNYWSLLDGVAVDPWIPFPPLDRLLCQNWWLCAERCERPLRFCLFGNRACGRPLDAKLRMLTRCQISWVYVRGSQNVCHLGPAPPFGCGYTKNTFSCPR